METYRVPLVPGPTTVPREVLSSMAVDYGSADLEPEFFQLYEHTQSLLQEILRTRKDVVVMAGEAMVVLWGALKSCLQPRDRLLAVANGLYGYGVAEWARSLGAEVRVVEYGYSEAIDPHQVEAAVAEFRPHMVSMVHCETPSGMINPVAEVGRAIRRQGAALFFVDAVSSAGGARLETDEWHVDLCLVGTQKCLSAPPGLGMVAVSPTAWEAVERVRYQGYDALLPWRNAAALRLFPYTMPWHLVAALNAACERLLKEGLNNAIARHAQVAGRARELARGLGLELFPERETDSSPTVTALRVPSRLSWEELDGRLRQQGMAVGGSYGPLAGRVFRLGHMGAQAELALVEQGMAVLEGALR